MRISGPFLMRVDSKGNIFTKKVLIPDEPRKYLDNILYLKK